MRGNSFKLEEDRFRDAGKELFTQRVVGHQNRLRRDIVGPFVLVIWKIRSRWSLMLLPTEAVL